LPTKTTKTDKNGDSYDVLITPNTVGLSIVIFA
jgi:hypothetical protein